MWKCAGCKEMHADFRDHCPIHPHISKPVKAVRYENPRVRWEREERRDAQSCCECGGYVRGTLDTVSRCSCCDEPMHKKCSGTHEPKCWERDFKSLTADTDDSLWDFKG